jgi:EKC/KEOPS complex subunit PCC1/LAGE3
MIYVISLGNDGTPSSVRIPFANSKHANIAKQVIEVDRELQPQAVKRELSVEGDVLVAYVLAILRFRNTPTHSYLRSFSTLTVRLARLSLNSFLENVDLVVRTISQFADDAEHRPMPPTYS